MKKKTSILLVILLLFLFLFNSIKIFADTSSNGFHKEEDPSSSISEKIPEEELKYEGYSYINESDIFKETFAEKYGDIMPYIYWGGVLLFVALVVGGVFYYEKKKEK